MKVRSPTARALPLAVALAMVGAWTIAINFPRAQQRPSSVRCSGRSAGEYDPRTARCRCNQGYHYRHRMAHGAELFECVRDCALPGTQWRLAPPIPDCPACPQDCSECPAGHPLIRAPNGQDLCCWPGFIAVPRAGGQGFQCGCHDQRTVSTVPGRSQPDIRCVPCPMNTVYSPSVDSCVCPPRMVLEGQRCECAGGGQVDGGQCECPAHSRWQTGDCVCAVGWIMNSAHHCVCARGTRPNGASCQPIDDVHQEGGRYVCNGTHEPRASLTDGRCVCPGNSTRTTTVGALIDCACPDPAHMTWDASRQQCICNGNLLPSGDGQSCGCPRLSYQSNNVCLPVRDAVTDDRGHFGCPLWAARVPDTAGNESCRCPAGMRPVGDRCECDNRAMRPDPITGACNCPRPLVQSGNRCVRVPLDAGAASDAGLFDAGG